MTGERKEGGENLKAKQKKLLASQMAKQYSPSAVGKLFAAFSIYATKTFEIHHLKFLSISICVSYFHVDGIFGGNH